MKRFFQITLVLGTSALVSPMFGQVSNAPVTRFRSGFPFTMDTRLEVPHNRRELIRKELLDTNTVLLIAKSVGITNEQLTGFCVAPELDGKEVWFYLLRDDATNAYSRVGDRLLWYAQARLYGHTPEYLHAALTNDVNINSVLDPDLRALLRSDPLLPTGWLTREDSGTRTNEAGEVLGRWVSFHLVDDGLGWRYDIQFSLEGTVQDILTTRFDAKDVLPEYKSVIKEVERDVLAEMQASGATDKFGSVHTFWILKKAKLKERGIEWRSPDDLNPNVHYD